jgi:hypothetical protein
MVQQKSNLDSTMVNRSLNDNDDDVSSDVLLSLAARITSNAHLLLPGKTDQQLVHDTLQGVKLAFDRGE